jgi:hypothetical protein
MDDATKGFWFCVACIVIPFTIVIGGYLLFGR